MHHFRKILVGVDLHHGDRLAAAELNPPTQEAIRRAVWLASRLKFNLPRPHERPQTIRQAVWLASRCKAELTFFAALDISAKAQELLEQGLPNYQQNVKVKAQAVLDGLVEDAAKAGVLAKSRLAIGPAAIEIIRHVVQEKIDLVVVGTRNLGVAGRILLGSTGLKLLRRCPCPVWVTKPDPDWSDLNILVATDLTEVGQSAIAVAIGCAQLTHAKVHLLHAVEHPYDFGIVADALPAPQIDELRNKAREEAAQAVNNQLCRTDYRTLKQGVQVHIEEGPADAAILDAVDRFGIDLLVMGTVGRGGIPGFLVGNTAERVFPHVSCSVLAIKPRDFDCGIHCD